MENVRSTATLSLPGSRLSPSGTSSSVTYSRYASSSTIRTSSGTVSRNRSSASRRTAVPVGLFGLHTNTTRVFGVIAAAMASRSWV